MRAVHGEHAPQSPDCSGGTRESGEKGEVQNSTSSSLHQLLWRHLCFGVQVQMKRTQDEVQQMIQERMQKVGELKRCVELSKVSFMLLERL